MATTASSLKSTNDTSLITTVLRIHKDENKLPFLPLFTVNNDLLVALIDTGSDCSLISDTTASKLQLQPNSTVQMKIQGINSSYSYDSNQYQLKIKSVDGHRTMAFQSHPKLETTVKMPTLTFQNLQEVEDLTNCDLVDYWYRLQGSSIDMIIGCDLLWSILTNIEVHNIQDNLLVVKTDIGICIIPRPNSTITHQEHQVFSASTDTPVNIHQQYRKLDELIERMWQLDVLGIQPPTLMDDEKSVDDLLIQRCKTEAEFRDGKIHVSFPFNGKENHLSDNFPVAKRRLTSLLNTLHKKPEVMAAFTKTLKEQEDQGIIEKCENPETHFGPVYYIPLQVVEKPDSETTKIRIVIDASSHMKGELSLNDCLYPGPTILRPLLGILLRSRLTKYIVTSDIEKAFHQVRIQEKFRDAARFIWMKDPSIGPKPNNYTIYRFTRLPFGVTCSPFLLALTIMFYLERAPHPINEKILENLYVDNLMLASNHESDMESYYHKLKTTFNGMFMNLREFATNSKSTMQKIPEKDRNGRSEIKLLGLFWNTCTDELTIRIPEPPPSVPTKRELSSFIGSIYDPTGLMAPATVRVKGFLQSIWESGVLWDQLIPDETVPMWKSISEEFNDTKFTLPRQLISNYDYDQVELIMFSDASQKHFACCAYLRFVSKIGTVQTRLIMSKHRVKPNKDEHLTIPRLELLAVLTATNAAVTIVDELHMPIKKVEFFTDSMIALHWLMGDEKLKTYVFNHSQMIKENCKRLNDQEIPTTFYHCPTKLNPADIGSRGMKLNELKTNSLWFDGPEFLKKPETEWPTKISRQPIIPKFLRLEVMKECHPPPKIKGKESDLDTNCHFVNLVSTYKLERSYTSIIPYNRTNSFVKLTKTMSYALRFLTKLAPERQWTNRIVQKFATSDDATERWISAKNLIIIDHYKDAEANLNATIPPDYNPTLDEAGLIRCVRRISNSELPMETKRPIILMKDHKLTDLIVRDTHNLNNHIGPTHLVTKIREKYWIPRILQLCRKIFNSCVKCKKMVGRPFRQAEIAPLPEERVIRAAPFEHIGVDYLGPVYYQGRSTEKMKCWVMLATCLITRNIHLEVIQNNSTATFLLAVKRLFGRRGVPSSMTLDNAPAFRLGTSMTNKEILERDTDSESLTSYLARNEVKVRFITPYSPWQGGVYERMIGIVKQLLYRTVNPVNLDRYELDTMLVEIEAIVNSRPLSVNPQGRDNAPVLRPIDLIIPNIKLSIPYDFTSHTEISPGKTQTTEEMTKTYIASFNEQVEETWKLWSSLYLTNLKEANHRNHNYSRTEPKVGQVVLVSQENLPRHQWPLGWILRVYTSRDGKERKATLKCRNRFYDRSLCQLIPLEIIHEDIGIDEQDLPSLLDRDIHKPIEQKERSRPLLERAAKKPVKYSQ